MPKVHYIVRRSRMGRFNFTFISELGRITGSVVVPIAGSTGAAIERNARDQIRHLAETFTEIARSTSAGVDNISSTTCEQMMSPALSAIAS